jgi:[protein-PII] uridylyltransferase
MQINLATIERQAAERLRELESAPSHEERVEAIKRFLRTETHRLQLRHRFGIGGADVVRARSLIIDLVVQKIAGESSPGLAIVALGGYGRRELAPQSDIDILFLHRGRRDAARARELSESILYMLWDVGLTVGHSLRSLKDCISISRSDSSSRTALIDARLLWGDGELFRELNVQLDRSVFSDDSRAFLDELILERASRFEKFGSVVCLQEPNIKETAGGLRDLQTMLWASRIAYGHPTVESLVEARKVPERDAKGILTAYDYLLRVRNELHFLTGRRNDVVSLDVQQQAAKNLRYQSSEKMQASELFMRDYYLHARRLHRLTALHFERAARRPAAKGWLNRVRYTAAPGGFVMRDGELDLAPESSAQLGTEGMMLAFSYSQATGAPLSGAVQEAVSGGLSRINRTYRTSADAAESFVKMLGVRGRVASVLRLMHDNGFLGKYIPEFGRITCLVQHDLYHRYTIDEHTLRAIETLDELANSRSRTLERYRLIYAAIENPAVLHLGLLLHDIGKGLGGGHTEKGVHIAERICARLHLEKKAVDDVIFLIRQHLLMSHISQRRDLADEKVIEGFANHAGSLDRLRMLTLLTYGDTSGVGPGIWNEWKDALLWELYLKAALKFEPDAAQETSIEPLKERITQMLASEIAGDAVRDHFNSLPDTYAKHTPSQVIIEHVRLAAGLKSRVVRTSWRVNVQARCTDLHICARNRRGLFAAITGALTSQGVNILSVQLNTRGDGIAVDSFKVRDTAGEPITDPLRWELIENEVKRALSGEIDVAGAVARRLRAQASRLGRKKYGASVPTRITWDNDSSERATILEVRTSDRLGLAYKIASTLAALDLDIAFAKVATEKHLALDIFYVTKEAGRKLDEIDLPDVDEAIRHALDEEVQTAARAAV